MARLLVPIALDALVVRSSGGTWAQTRMQQPQEPPAGSPAHRQQLLPAPFTDLPGPRPAGVYLHWALADGLTRLQGWTGNLPPRTLPVPSRWMILRLSGNPSPKRQVAAWLLPNIHRQEPQVVGDILTRRDRIPVEQVSLPLSSAGHGDLGWSAYFDNVRNRLGFHDPLQGVTGPVAYLVCGWYTHTRYDPLAADQPLSESAFRGRLAELGWYADGPVPDPAPRQSLYHGSAVGIAWPGTTWTGDGGGSLSAESGGPPHPQDVAAALGETISAAVSSLVTGAGDPIELGLLVEGLAQQALGELSRADGTERLLGVLHASRFGEVPQPRRRETIYRPPEVLADPAPVAATAGGAAATAGDVHDALAAATPEALSQPAMADTGGDMTTDVGEFTVVDRTQPRLFHPVDPVLVLEGARRGYRHGGDGRFDSRDRLRCRYTGQTVTAMGAPGQTPPRGADVAPGWYAVDVPQEVHALFDELASLDPGSAPDRKAGTAPSPTAAARSAWWTTWDRSDPAAPFPDPPPYTIVGVPPSPVAVTPPSRPWTPVHLAGEADWRASTRGARDWHLGELDYERPPGGAIPGAGRTLRGRGMLTPAPAALLGGAADRVADDLAAAGGETLVAELDAATAAAGPAGAGAALAGSDLLSGSLQGFLDRVRGVPEGQLVEGKVDEPEPAYPVTPLRAGFLSLRRLRVVDTFGQVVDLLGSSATTPVDPARLRLQPDLAVAGAPGLAALVPRFTAPARVLLRFTEPTTGLDAWPGQSPVCGFLVPSPLDGTLEFFDAAGANLGRLLADASGGSAWEEAPGRPATAGRTPSQLVEDPTLGRLGDGILAYDTAARAAGTPAGQTALASLLRVIDTTQWTVDLTGKSGDEHLALLLGNPVVVLRARLLLEVDDELGAGELERTAVAVRLGSLQHSEDGLLGYFVGDDFSRVHVVDRAVAELALPLAGGAAAAGSDPLRGYVDDTGVLWVHPGHPLALTLLVTPGADVTVTSGLLPQKAVGLRREWTEEGLGALTPTLRYGPVLRDPKVTRLPVPADIHGNWTWHRRPEPGRWATDGVVPATGDALLAEAPPVLSAGWLRLTLTPEVTFAEHAVGVQVTCIDKPSATASIRALGGTNRDGSRWRLPIDQAIELVESGRFRFFVVGGGRSADLEVDVTPAGRKYLRTAFDRIPENNLLALPRCEPM